MSLDTPQKQELADFLRRYQEDPNSISAEEATSRYRELIGMASPEAAAEAHDQAFAQLPSQERQALAQQFEAAQNDPGSPFDGYGYDDLDTAAAPRTLGLMAQQASRQDGGLLDRLLGKDSPLNSTLGRLAMSAAAAYLARKLLGGQGQAGAPSGGGLDIDSILRALGQAQAQRQGGASGQEAPLGGLDIDSILRALGALQQGGAPGGSGRGAQQAPGGLDIGDLLDALGRMQGGAQTSPPQGSQGESPGVKKPDLSVLLGEKGDAQSKGRPDLSAILDDDKPNKDG
jgi:hypothetical protein